MNPETDIVIIGSGLAGLYCALHAADHADVIVLTQAALTDSNSLMAQGGVAAVLDPDDSIASHIEDTLIAGAYHNDPSAVEVLVNEGPAHIKKLMELGVVFDQKNGFFDLAQEGGHHHRRIAHVRDATGKAMVDGVLQQARNHPRITILEQHEVTALVTNTDHTRVVGVRVRSDKKERVLTAQAVVLATGGSGQLYEHTTNPTGAIGSGVALAHAVGAKTQDMEFIQFHPTALLSNDSPHFLLSEALRGEGALLRNAAGDRFMEKYDQRLELAPRDIVSRAIFEEQKMGRVFLDCTHKSKAFLQETFPMICGELSLRGLHLEKDLIPITPAAHYQCGGVTTDLNGQTTMPGLYAIGEVARTGVHGANRLASNSLLECLVFAARASEHIKQQKKVAYTRSVYVEEADVIHDEQSDSDLRARIQQVMWEHVGIVRTKEGLQHARTSLQTLLLKENLSFDTRSMLTAALLIVQAAQARPESIGAHYMM